MLRTARRTSIAVRLNKVTTMLDRGAPFWSRVTEPQPRLATAVACNMDTLKVGHAIAHATSSTALTSDHVYEPIQVGSPDWQPQR